MANDPGVRSAVRQQRRGDQALLDGVEVPLIDPAHAHSQRRSLGSLIHNQNACVEKVISHFDRELIGAAVRKQKERVTFERAVFQAQIDL